MFASVFPARNVIDGCYCSGLALTRNSTHYGVGMQIASTDNCRVNDESVDQLEAARQSVHALFTSLAT